MPCSAFGKGRPRWFGLSREGLRPGPDIPDGGRRRGLARRGRRVLHALRRGGGGGAARLGCLGRVNRLGMPGRRPGGRRFVRRLLRQNPVGQLGPRRDWREKRGIGNAPGGVLYFPARKRLAGFRGSLMGKRQRPLCHLRGNRLRGEKKCGNRRFLFKRGCKRSGRMARLSGKALRPQDGRGGRKTGHCGGRVGNCFAEKSTAGGLKRLTRQLLPGGSKRSVG